MDVATAIEQKAVEGAAEGWSAGKRLVFRFCFAYFGLYCLCGLFQAVILIPKIDVPDPGTLWPFRQAIFWVAAHLFGAKLPLIFSGSGSGDKPFDWTEVFCVLIAALFATAIWSIFDRRRTSYAPLYKWFRLFIRFSLAATILLYAFDKIVPLQMSFPGLASLLEPYGNFSPMGVLWNSIGASPAYEIFAGLAELLGAVLLMFPRTVTLGALVCAADMFQVFMLNMTYDVPVKQFSFHLLLLSLFLLAPQLGRLTDFFLRNRPASLKSEEKLFRSPRANRIAGVVQAALWIWILGMNMYQTWGSWHQYGSGRQKPVLYGIWDVNQMTIDGQVRSPLLTDDDRWRRMIFDYPQTMAVQHMNDSFEWFASTIDTRKMSIDLTKRNDKNWKANLAFLRPAADQLNLDGTMNGHKVQMQLKREDETRFTLSSRGFHWVQEYPFNH
ncbi:MAG: hypothetical protein WA354_14665 [Terracidiphilus sp.]